MYQYKAVLNSNQEIIAEAHSIEDIEKQIKRFKREQKQNLHTRGNDTISIYHVNRKTAEGNNNEKEKLVKVV
ncbi:MAG6790 family protein [Mycoplasma elephantis]|uniref:MAG6790 family protein n=1 Tax=Mycoplasma elephantis TaxID=114882 RepID=UPI000486C8CC|nr:hypothetical protein [Mycoplasma elephantis]